MKPSVLPGQCGGGCAAAAAVGAAAVRVPASLLSPLCPVPLLFLRGFYHCWNSVL